MSYVFERHRALGPRALAELRGRDLRQWKTATRREGFRPRRAVIYRIRNGPRVRYTMWYFPESDDGAVFVAGTARRAGVDLIQGDFEGRPGLAFALQWAAGWGVPRRRSRAADLKSRTTGPRGR